MLFRLPRWSETGCTSVVGQGPGRAERVGERYPSNPSFKGHFLVDTRQQVAFPAKVRSGTCDIEQQTASRRPFFKTDKRRVTFGPACQALQSLPVLFGVFFDN